MSIKITKLIRRDKTNQLTGLEMAILIYLSEFASDEGTQIFPSVETIVTQTKFCRTSVKKALKELEVKGRITKEARKNGFRDTSNLYQINLREVAKAAGISLVDNNPDIPTEGSPHDLVGGRHTTPQGSPHDPDQSLINYSFKSHCKKAVSVDNFTKAGQVDEDDDFYKEKDEKKINQRVVQLKRLKANSKAIESVSQGWNYSSTLNKKESNQTYLNAFNSEEYYQYECLTKHGIYEREAIGIIKAHSGFHIYNMFEEIKKRKPQNPGSYLWVSLVNLLGIEKIHLFG